MTTIIIKGLNRMWLARNDIAKLIDLEHEYRNRQNVRPT